MSRTTQNDITNRTLKEIIRELNKFQEFVFSYLLNFRDKDDKNPKFSSLSMLRSSIKIQLMEAYGLDISNKEHFPKFQNRWLETISELYADGMTCK